MSNLRILLADDHAIVRAGISNTLKELPGLEIVGEVGDGPSLFAALAQTRPNFLLIDVTMPDFDPIAAIREIRMRYPTLKILVVSAHDDDVYVQGLLGAGVDGYHMKDQTLSDLRLAVQRVQAGERWISSRLVEKLVRRAPASAGTPSLTARQQEMLQLLQQGFDNQTIARQMELSVKTVENHLTRLYRQLNVQSRLEAVNYITRHPEVVQEVVLGSVQIKPAEQIPITILLVDDNARYRRQLRRMVGKVCPQATIYEAQNIDEATQLAQQFIPRLVLVDVVLGEEDGIQCTRRIKALLPQARIVLITAYPDREFRRLGLEAGAVALLDKKDLDATALHQVVEDLIA
jgi:DNA-binding NarL/FixJ family response regulator